MPRRRHQQGRVYLRGKCWVGTYRTYDINPETGKRMRRTITFDESVTSERAALKALEPYLAEYNARAKADYTQRLPKRGGKKLVELVDEWTSQILPNRKYGGARACQSHIRAYIKPLLGDISLRELTTVQHQQFVTAVGLRTGRRRTTENVYATLRSILNSGRAWGYAIPDVNRRDIVFPADLKAQTETLFFDADTAARIINAARQPYKIMCLIAAICGLRIGEVTALKITSLDFNRRLINITAALDYATRKETTPKSAKSAAPIPMSNLLEKHLRNWVEKHYRPNESGYLFINANGKPYLSDLVVRYGVHRTIKTLGIATPKGVHLGIHCFRHGVTTELLESGTPIHVVTRMMRHGDSKVTLDHYAHIVGDAERVASERLSTKIGAQLESDPELESVSTKSG